MSDKVSVLTLLAERSDECRQLQEKIARLKEENNQYREAIEEITRLQEENARLRELLEHEENKCDTCDKHDALQRDKNFLMEQLNCHIDILKQVQAERDKYRRALEEILQITYSVRITQIAKKALNKE